MKEPFKHFKTAFSLYVKKNKGRQLTDKDLRKQIEAEGYILDQRKWFNDLGKQMPGIIGLDLKVNPLFLKDRKSDGSLKDFDTSGAKS